MARKALSEDTIRSVMVMARRRCCICFGLNRDTDLKQGQIVHLDRDPTNPELDNLAFLCLEHHDQYDSRTSQSKGLTAIEVRHFRQELHEAIEKLWNQPVAFGNAVDRPTDAISGHYVRNGEFSSAELDVILLRPKLSDRADSRKILVTGLALWGKTRPYGPNLGELRFESELVGSRAVFEDRKTMPDRVYRLVLEFQKDGLLAKEDYIIGYHGMNVSFEGQYRRV